MTYREQFENETGENSRFTDGRYTKWLEVKLSKCQKVQMDYNNKCTQISALEFANGRLKAKLDELEHGRKLGESYKFGEGADAGWKKAMEKVEEIIDELKKDNRCDNYDYGYNCAIDDIKQKLKEKVNV